VTATRGGGGGTVGTGQVVGNDNSTFLNETVAGGAVTTYDGRTRDKLALCRQRRN
jgi:flagellar hook protein FlgE